MMNDETRQALEAILRQDRRPWRTVTEADAEIAELHLPRKLRDDAAHVADGARQLGFEVELRDHDVIQESVTSAGLDVILLIIKAGACGAGALILANKAVKAANEL